MSNDSETVRAVLKKASVLYPEERASSGEQRRAVEAFDRIESRFREAEERNTAVDFYDDVLRLRSEVDKWMDAAGAFRRDRDRLREALKRIATMAPRSEHSFRAKVARAALEGSET